ncbi:MAG TPA: glycine betaine ABC transporter substrate-binding protein [Trueperaceae bacterium]|nr:glycine betaine ABC transporter substrate-binding protein [Trueperaceae bacterium]
MKRPIALLLSLALLATGGLGFAQDAPIRVASKQFTEQLVLGKIIVLALEDAGFEVTDQVNLGSSDVNRLALENAESDIYPEYTGTFLNYVPAGVEVPEGVSQNAEGLYQWVSETDLENNNLVWLEPAPANNTYAFAVTSAFAEEHGLATVADFAAYVNDGGEVMMAVGDEFAQRADGLQAFEEAYGFELTDDQLLVIAGGTPAQTEQALAEGANNVNVAMAFATDGALMAYNFVVLADPEGAQPVFQPTPVVRGEVLEANPEIADVLNPIFASLSNEVLQELNSAVDVAGENPEDVARGYLEENDFIGQ